MSVVLGGSVWRWRLLAGALILAAAGLRLAYLAGDCPLDLAPDEAHYWDWSRHLDWCFYSKGPLVACLIRGGCVLAGPWSRHLPANQVLAVRLPAIVCGSLLLVSLYLLTTRVFGRERLAMGTIALALTMPVFAAGSSLMTIDAPYTCCWGWALLLGHQAVFRRSAWAWPATGLVVGLGILAKYTMLLWLGSFVLFLLATPEHRRLLRRPGFWVMAGVAAACCVPVVWWNLQQDWVGWRHVSTLAGLRDSPAWHWSGPVVYLGTQLGLLLGFWFVAWVAAMVAYRPSVEADPGARYLWWMSAPTFAVFLAFSAKTNGGEANWPVTAYLAGLVLTVAWLARQLPSPRAAYRRLVAGGLTGACALGLVVTFLMHHSEAAYPLFAPLAGPSTAVHPCPLRRIDPTCRLRGWRTLAAEVDRLRAELRDEGIGPVLAATTWALPGELAFYCDGNPTVYSVGSALGDRQSQYDLWRPNPVCDPEAFAGRTFVIVGYPSPRLAKAFERLGPPRVLVHRERGEPVAAWTLVVGYGFRGFERREGKRF
jgi:4-amino-4-deoxy-L-arabinose transferase-like glycosyltransferase